MDGIISCAFCNSHRWVIGSSGVVCAVCGFRLKRGLILADVEKANNWLKDQLKEYKKNNLKANIPNAKRA